MSKRVLAVILAVVTIVSCCFVLTACNKNTTTDETTATAVNKYEIAEYEAYVGDEFKAANIVVTAYLNNDTTKTVTNNRIYSAVDQTKLELDDSKKFTKAGNYTLRVYLLEEREDLLMGTCSIKVLAKKEI